MTLLSVFSKTKPLLSRCLADIGTKLRLKYQPYYHVVDEVEGPYVFVKSKKLLMMSSNEYLGLSQHPYVKEAAAQAIQKWGTSPCGSRLANGSRRYHIDLEEALAQFLGTESCHVTSAGYLACMASVSTLVTRGDALIVDKSIHAALWEGALLSNATIERFEHEDMELLESILKLLPEDQAKAIAVDGVYSMEGHIASLPRIVELAEKYLAALIVDDAHGLGTLGKNGRGVGDHFDLSKHIDIFAGSFSKSLASIGGYVAGKQEVIEFLRSNCRQINFSAALPPAQAAAALAALQIIQKEPEHLARLRQNIAHYRSLLARHRIDYWNCPTAGIPLVIGDKENCYRVWSCLWDMGYFTVMAISPGVPKGKELIRTAVSALHTPEQIEGFVAALLKAFQKCGVNR